MKALKEKRINLRSLWRRSLVILSLLAMVLAACGDSDSGDGSGVTAQPPRTIVSAELINFPYHRASDGGALYEGVPVNLNGVQVRIHYQGGGFEVVENLRNFSIVPPIYMLSNDPFGTAAFHADRGQLRANRAATYGNVAREDGTDLYVLTFAIGEFRQEWTIYNGPIEDLGNNFGQWGTGSGAPRFATGEVTPLIHAAYSREPNKMEYRVDEDINLAGIQIHGYYGNVDQGMSNWHRIELTPYMHHYQWRWVWNDANDYANQQAGVLFRIGTYGSFRRGDPTPAGGGISGSGTGDALTGLRIPVNRLWQVSSIDFERRPPITATTFPTIFYDDPRYIGVASEGFQWEYWTRALRGPITGNDPETGNRLIVSYVGTNQTYPIPIGILPNAFLNSHWSNTVAEWNGWAVGAENRNERDGNRGSGRWDRPELAFFIDDTLTLGGENGDPRDANDWQGVVHQRSLIGSAGETTMRQRWLTWIEDYRQLGYEYRGAYVRQEIPVYVTPTSIDVTPAPGFSAPIVMDGGNRVDGGREGQPHFLQRVRVSLNYQLAASEINFGFPDIRPREDVVADQRAGTMRGRAPGAVGSNPGTVLSTSIEDDALTQEASSDFEAEGTLASFDITVYSWGPTNASEDVDGTYQVAPRNYRDN